MFWLSEERLAERERKRQERVRRLGQKLREWCNLDNIVDASVDYQDSEILDEWEDLFDVHTVLETVDNWS